MINSFESMREIEDKLSAVEEYADLLKNSAMLSYDPKIHRDFSVRCTGLLKEIHQEKCSKDTKEFLKLRLMNIVEELVAEVEESTVNVSEIYMDFKK